MGIRLKDLSKLGYRDNVARSLVVDIVSKHCKYDTKEQIEMTHKIERKVSKTIKSEIIERLEKLKSEMNDMDQYVRQDVNNENLRDEDIFRINEKIKDLEKQILNVIEG